MKSSKLSNLTSRKAFGLAVQALVYMSMSPGLYPSSAIAAHLHSEATVIRRILAKLTQDQILDVREGRDGGYRLNRPAEAVTLAEVYQSLQMEFALCESMLNSTGEHSWGMQMHDVFSDMTDEINQSVIRILQNYTIADVAQRMDLKNI